MEKSTKESLGASDMDEEDKIIIKQAGAELDQAQLKLGFDFTLVF